MTSTILFDVIDALYAKFDAALPGIVVSDGFAVTQDPGSYLMVGIEDPETTGLPVAATSRQQWATLGDRQRDDNGAVWCVAESWNGDANQKAARVALKTTLDAAASVVNADPTLGGVTGLLWAGYGVTSNLMQAQNENGAIARMSFQIAYRTRIHTT